MQNSFKIKKEYKKYFDTKFLCFSLRKTEVIYNVYKPIFSSVNTESGSRIKNKLSALGIYVDLVHADANFVIRFKYGNINAWIYQCKTQDHVQYMCEIKDLVIKEKYRNQGIGSVSLQLLEEICIENGVRNLFGILERGGDLEARKRFYARHNFTFISIPRAKGVDIGIVKNFDVLL